MTDVRAVLRVTDELLWMLRRAGFAIATSQAIDCARAVRTVGFESQATLRDALASVVVQRARDRVRFERAFDAFFAPRPRETLWERLASQGFTETEIDTLRSLLGAFATPNEDGLGALVQRGAALDRLLLISGDDRLLAGLQSPLQRGFFTHRLLERVGIWRARDELGALRTQLVDALGEARAATMIAALEREIESSAEEARRYVDATLERRALDAADSDDIMETAFAALDSREIDDVRRAVRTFVERLRGGERVRRRRAKRGRVDAHGTMRRAMRTQGVPFALVRKAKRRDKAKLVLLCDISDSVRSVATFLLELAYAAQELFDGTRSFVFVSELGETTALFQREAIETALARANQGAVVPVTHNSNYGRVLMQFEERVLRDLDRRTTVVILGDGRTNYQSDAADMLDAIRSRCHALVWLCPEPRSSWATGDSAMTRYAPKCSHVLEVRCAADLEAAARLLLALRS